MKILAINGSGRGKGNTRTLLEAMGAGMPSEVDFEIVDLNRLNFGGCIGCEGCAKTNKCVVKDDMQMLYEKIEEADGMVLGSPTYFYNITAKMKAFIERFYALDAFDPEDRSVWISLQATKGLKYGAVIAVCEQKDAKDMGFTAEAMSGPLQDIGFQVVSTQKVLHLFGRHDAEGATETLDRMAMAGMKLYRTIRLAQGLK